MKSPTLSSHKKGFTLVELLVVISIIAGLAAIAFSVVMRQVDKARIVGSKEACSSIANAIEQFYTDNNTFPVTMIPAAGKTITTRDDDPSELITILLGREKGRGSENINRTGQKYLSGSTSDDRIGGLYIDASSAGYYDDWGNPYFVILDVNGRDEIADPTNGKPVFKRKALVYGMGPDMMGSAADGKIKDKELIEDNVYSWKNK